MYVNFNYRISRLVVECDTKRIAIRHRKRWYVS